ncbi:hypothetical protein ACWJJH_21810 [Endozoicomonadaceae bacterium StTr2]
MSLTEEFFIERDKTAVRLKSEGFLSLGELETLFAISEHDLLEAGLISFKSPLSTADISAFTLTGSGKRYLIESYQELYVRPERVDELCALMQASLGSREARAS